MSARPAARAALEVTDGSDDDTTPVSESVVISSKICPAVRRAFVVGGRYASRLKESTESTEDDGCFSLPPPPLLPLPSRTADSILREPSSRARDVGDGDAVVSDDKKSGGDGRPGVSYPDWR
ncbi:hypothetical protein BGZ47_006428 [Haplosporangium gracile]|nr:hypothetical protein BGZ47_006428 [Haplosporangium gracile]